METHTSPKIVGIHLSSTILIDISEQLFSSDDQMHLEPVKPIHAGLPPGSKFRHHFMRPNAPVMADTTLALHKSRLMAISRSFQSRQVMQQFLLDRLIG